MGARHNSAHVEDGESSQAPWLEPPPEYDELEEASRLLLLATTTATDDGRINVDLDSKLARAVAKLIDIPDEKDEPCPPPPDYSLQAPWLLPMNIVVQVVGSRGDVQPFVALGNELKKAGHRIRIATHNVFKDFVRDAGLEFFPIGGDPAQLMAYMVKNPGLIPSMKTLRDGEIKKKRKMIAEMLHGCWRSCIEADRDTKAPFVANAIIANPVSFAHIHCAQAMSIPLHLVFTMPWTPTRAFPHPLANIQNTSTDPRLANYLSYGLVQALTWQGLGGVINDFRKTLDLDVLPATEAPFLAETLRVPYTYCWSPALVPKPKDWADHIDVSGFIFRQPPQYEPPPTLAKFLSKGPPPVYIGFGSIVVDDPQGLLAIVLEAVKLSGVRAIVSRGWSDLSCQDVPNSVIFLGDCPHEWLFQHVSAVVHHGGAGTTAAGLLHGKPTTIIPFFGDQPFWGDRIAAAGAGPTPIPYKKLNAVALAHAIRFCHGEQAIEAAYRISESMRMENGVEVAAASFYRHLQAEMLRCDLVPSIPAVYRVSIRSKEIKLSASASQILIKNDRIKAKQLKLYEPSPITIYNRRWDPITAWSSSAGSVVMTSFKALNGLWYEPYKLRRDTVRKNSIRQSFSSAEDASESPSESAPVPGPARMTGASVLSIPKLYGLVLKEIIIDTPVAITEGFRNVPRLYGENVSEHRPVTDWKSGAIVGGKEFGIGLGTGVVDLFVQPYKGARDHGAWGFVTGIGKGMVGSVTKLSTAGCALWAYPAQGIWKSMCNVAADFETRKTVFTARRIHDMWHSRRDQADEKKVLAAFEAWLVHNGLLRLARKQRKLKNRSESTISVEANGQLYDG